MENNQNMKNNQSGNNFNGNEKPGSGKHKTWLILGIVIAILAVAFLVLFSPIRDSFAGKAVGSQCSVDADCATLQGEFCDFTNGVCALNQFNLDVRCPQSVAPGQTFTCDLVLDTSGSSPVVGFFGAQFVINAPDFVKVQPFIQGQNGVQAFSTDFGQPTLVFKSTADGQADGTIATISLVAPSRTGRISNVFLSNLVLATGSVPAQVNVVGSSVVGGVCISDNDCQSSNCGNGFCGGSGAVCDQVNNQGTDCISGFCNNNVCSTQPEICGNSFDDDGDGATDCSDTDCSANVACMPTSATQCTDGIDNDGDGSIDFIGGCDSDGDGVVDVTHFLITSLNDCPAGTAQFIFADAGCSSSQDTSEGSEVCDNNLDDDGNFLIDCADPACTNDPVCQSNVIKGDANNDGNINIQDVLVVVNHIINTAPITDPAALDAANINCDASINIQDVLGVVNRIINPAQPPVC